MGISIRNKPDKVADIFRGAPVVFTVIVGLAAIGGIANDAEAAVPWNGYADYKLATGATGDESIVGPFSSFDFSNNGVVLIKPDAPDYGAFAVGQTFTGYYQSYVSGHSSSGMAIDSGSMNTQGALGDGSGYEITVLTTFTQEVTSVLNYANTSVATFNITGGSTALYFDTTPDFSFSADSGFDDSGITDGGVILSGVISGGASQFLTTAGVAGFGVTSIDLSIGLLDYDASVFSPQTISGGDTIFTMQINPGGVTSLVSSVQGNAVMSDDMLLQADGSLNLTTVPLPSSMVLLGTVLIGLVSFSTRRHWMEAAGPYYA